MLSKSQQASHSVLNSNAGENTEQLMRGGNRPVRSKRGHRRVDVCTHARRDMDFPPVCTGRQRVVLLGDRTGKRLVVAAVLCVPMGQDRQTREFPGACDPRVSRQTQALGSHSAGRPRLCAYRQRTSGHVVAVL